MKRRDFLGTNMLALASGALAAGGADAADTRSDENATIQSQLSPDVQMQFMRPAQLEAAEVGRRNVKLAAESIGRKAQELLASLPQDQRSFNLETVAPGHWWLV